MQINSGVRKDQKKTLEPLRMENIHFSERSSFFKEADTFMCKSIAVSGRIKRRPYNHFEWKISIFLEEVRFLKKADNFMCKSIAVSGRIKKKVLEPLRMGNFIFSEEVRF